MYFKEIKKTSLNSDMLGQKTFTEKATYAVSLLPDNKIKFNAHHFCPFKVDISRMLKTDHFRQSKQK